MPNVKKQKFLLSKKDAKISIAQSPEYAHVITKMYGFFKFNERTFLDVGCGLGDLVYNVKATDCFDKTIGIDCLCHKVLSGRTKFNLGFSELIASPMNQLPVENESISFLHCHDTLNLVSEDLIPKMLNEFYRITIHNGNLLILLNKNRMLCDPAYWGILLREYGFKCNLKLFLLFKEVIKNKASLYEEIKNDYIIFCMSKERV